MKTLLAEELDRRDTPPLKLQEISTRLRSLGYALDRSLDCRALSRYMTGPHAGASYPCLTTGITHMETGLSFAHVDAPRGDAFETLQAWRRSGELYAVIGGYILEI